MHVINSITPIFMIILVGKLLQKSGFFPAEFFRGMSRLVFWIFLPSLLIEKISTSEFDVISVSRVVLVMSVATLLCMLMAIPISRALKLPPRGRGAFVQGSFRGNLAYVGLPVIIFALSEYQPKAETLATVTLAPMVIVYNLFSVFILVHYGPDRERSTSTFRILLKPLVSNPLILACAIAICIKATGLALPVAVHRTLTGLAGASLPLALMSIGSSLSFERLHSAASPSLTAALIKIGAAPALGFLLACMMGLGTVELMITVLMLACPTAAASYVMADAMGSDTVIAGRVVAISTLLSAISLSLIIALGT